jgi:phosphatidylglycerol:prolipoprotein diacylglycerol transferase
MIRTASPYTPAVAPLASIVHTVDPYLIRFGSSGFGIRWYGLAYIAGFLAGWSILRWFARTGRTSLSVDRIGDLITALIVGVLVGGRVGHVVFYEPRLLTTFDGTFPFWGLLAINRGGMSSHGGMLGVFLACLWASRRFSVPFLHVADLVAFVAPIGLGLGRLANWANGELPGKALPAAMQAAPPWWSVKYPEEVFDEAFWRIAPEQKLEALGAFAQPGVELPRAIFDACYAGNAQVIEALTPFLTARYPNNFLQALTDGPILGAIVVLVWLRPRRPGCVAGAFLLGYGILRLLTEQYREPDPDILTLGPVTLPMTLSALLAVAGLATMLVARRSSQPRSGGLLPAA